MGHDRVRNFDREQELIEALNLDAATRIFLERWAPKDYKSHGRRIDFEADLFQIVRRIYREAQAPFVKAGAEAIARQPMPPIFVRNPDWAAPLDACIHCKQKPCACAVAQSAS